MGVATRDMVDLYADIVFVCDPESQVTYPLISNDIPACRFVCISTCSVIRDLLENVDIPLDPLTHRRTIRLHGASVSRIQRALDIIHGIQEIDSFNYDDVLTCRRGMEFLGCTRYDQDLADRLYMTARAHPTQENFANIAAPILLEFPLLRLSTMNELMRRMPFWTEMRTYLKEHVHITRHLAKYLIPLLVKFYPASFVFQVLVENMQAASVSQDCIMELLGVAEIGIYFHPIEISDTLSFLVKIFKSNGWDTHTCNALQTLKLATYHYDAVPDIARCVQGSLVMYTTFPTCSVTLNVADRLVKVVKMRVAPWLNVTINPRTGTFGASINISKIDEMAHAAPHLQMRLMVFSKTEIGEVWYDWVDIPDARSFPLESCDIVLGSHEKVRQVLMSESLHCIRIDFFYGNSSVLENPLCFGRSP